MKIPIPVGMKEDGSFVMGEMEYNHTITKTEEDVNRRLRKYNSVLNEEKELHPLYDYCGLCYEKKCCYEILLMGTTITLCPNCLNKVRKLFNSNCDTVIKFDKARCRKTKEAK